MRTLWEIFFGNLTSHLASTKGWPKLRLANSFKKKIEKQFSFFFSETRKHVCLVLHSRAEWNRRDRRTLVGSSCLFYADFIDANAECWGEATFSFLCVFHLTQWLLSSLSWKIKKNTVARGIFRNATYSSTLSRVGKRISYLVDSASSHMLVSKIKPCMSKYTQIILWNCEWLIKSVIVYLMFLATWITVVILELIHA